jgi:hypothetical protein
MNKVAARRRRFGAAGKRRYPYTCRPGAAPLYYRPEHRGDCFAARRKLLAEFSAFYKNALTNGVGTYKSYVIKNNVADAERIQALIELLQKNKIEFGYAKGGSVRGFNYGNGRDESMNTNTSDLVIPTTQQRGTLVNVLFEPVTELSDSVTYDITAWALPYAYGLQAIASRSAVPFTTSAGRMPNL